MVWPDDMKRKQHIWILVLALVLMGFSQCTKDSFFKQESNYLVIDRPDSPSDRLIASQKPLSFHSFKSTNDADELQFTLQYFLNSPEVDGAFVQATHIVFKANKLYLSYNTEGELVRGGLEVIDFTDPDHPQVMATGIRDGEFSSLDIFTNPASGTSYLLMAGAGWPLDGQPSPQVRLFELNASGYPVMNPTIIDLDGFTATDINRLGVVSGTDGGFYILDELTLSFAELEVNLDDARSVAFDPVSQQYVVLTGTPGALITGIPNNPVTYDLGGLEVLGSKAIVRIWNGLAFVSLGQSGLKVIDMASGEVKASLDRPDIPEGENPNNFVTNGLSVHEEGYVFIANGAAGVYVAKYEASGELTVLGSLDLDASVNYVEARGEYLFAATGSKGVAIIKMAGVNGPLPLVSTHPVSEPSISAYSAAGGGAVERNEGSEIINKGICWSTGLTPTIADARTNHGPGEGSFVSQMSGLQPETTYYVRAYATTEHGTFYGSVESFETVPSTYETDVMTDTRDGQEYRTIQIGQTIWMAENLAWLPAVSPVASGSLIDPYYYVYGYNGFQTEEAALTSSYQSYGTLYNWVAAQSACPDGWSLPTDADWMALEEYLGMSAAESQADRFRNTGLVGMKLKATSGWREEGNGSDVSRFTALPAGYRARGGEYKYQGSYAAFWTSAGTDQLATYRGLYYFNDGVYKADWYKTAGFSVRCVKK